MPGKYDQQIKELAAKGKGGQLIARKLGLNVGHVGRRLKVLGLTSGRTNQHSIVAGGLSITFEMKRERLPSAAEHFLKFLCDYAGYRYADPPAYEPFDLLVDFGDGWKKVQVKSTATDTFGLTKMKINTAKAHRQRYRADEVDYFFLFHSDRKAWLVPRDALGNRSSVRFKMLESYSILLE